MAERRAALAQRHDQELVDKLMRFARSQLGDSFADEAMRVFTARGADLVDGEMQLLGPWMLFGFVPSDRGGSAAERFQVRKGRYLMPDLRELLAAQLAAWLSPWVVEEVDPGTGAVLRDLLSGERRYVYEHLGTESLPVGVVMLARVVDVSGISFLAGVHVQPLPADRVFATVTAARKHFRVRTKPIAPERLRDPMFQEWLIGEWREIASALRRPPRMSNTDGDPLEPMVDHYGFDASVRLQVLVGLSTIPGAEEPEEGDTPGETDVVITRPGNRRNKAMQNTIIGVLRVGEDRLRGETNSTRRADALRRAVEKAVGGLVRHRLREETSIEHLMKAATSGEARAGRDPERPRPTSEQLEHLHDYKRRYYAAWLDERIPALAGATPRAAARSKTKREQVENLLRRLEELETSVPEEERFDVGWLRRELGM